MPDASSSEWVLVYDGDCAFCQYTVEYAAAVVGDSLRFQPYQKVASDYPDVALDEFSASIQLFTPQGRYAGAEAAFRVLAVAPRLAGWLWCYRFVPLFATLAEFAYRLTARHRDWAMRVAKVTHGRRLRPLEYGITASVMTRAVGVVFLIAFASWAVQADGLIGADGILPVNAFFDSAMRQLGAAAYYRLPSAYWLAPSHAMTLVLCGVGAVASLALILNRVPVVAALTAYLAYLSLYYGGQIFMGYQWDILLIECGALLVVLNLNTRTGIWLFRLLVFRFMFLSGAVKLLSGDPTWADLSALGVHFETQPLPTALAWSAHHLPESVLHFAVAATFVVELILPFFIFLPRNFRLFAFVAFVFLELLIFATGNYNFFNILTIVMCLALLDDRVLRLGKAKELARGRPGLWRAVLCAFVLLGAIQIHASFARRDLPAWERGLAAWVRPLMLVNGYGLFAVMTTRRDELIVQGSDDAQHWWDYRFRFKPEALDVAPRWVTPHQPRLDWQMWFAALRPVERVYWADNFVAKLLVGSESVTGLMYPTGQGTPRHVRILRYRYTFTTPDERAGSGRWWQREFIGVWYPATSLITPDLPTEPMDIPP